MALLFHLNNMLTEFRNQIQKIEEELVQRRDALKVSEDVNYVKVGVEFLSGKTGVHDMKLNSS